MESGKENVRNKKQVVASIVGLSPWVFCNAEGSRKGNSGCRDLVSVNYEGNEKERAEVLEAAPLRSSDSDKQRNKKTDLHSTSKILTLQP